MDILYKHFCLKLLNLCVNLQNISYQTNFHINCAIKLHILYVVLQNLYYLK